MYHTPREQNENNGEIIVGKKGGETNRAFFSDRERARSSSTSG